MNNMMNSKITKQFNNLNKITLKNKISNKHKTMNYLYLTNYTTNK